MATDRKFHMAIASVLANTEAPEPTVTAIAELLGDEANGAFDRDLFSSIAGDKDLAAALQRMADAEKAEKDKRAEKRAAAKARKAARQAEAEKKTQPAKTTAAAKK